MTTAAILLAECSPLPAGLVVDIVDVLADELAVWHARGLVHGTIQPGCIELILNEDRALVTAALTGFPSLPANLSPTLLMVNAKFIAPEVLGGEVFGPSADVWALACAAYEMLTGTVPFAGATAAETLQRMAAEVVPDFELPGDLGVVLGTALATDPRDRYDTAIEFAPALRRAATRPG